MSDWETGMRALQNAQDALIAGYIDQRGYEKLGARVRRRYGLRGWGDTHHE